MNLLEFCNLFEVSVLPVRHIENGVCSCGKITCPSPGKHPLISYNWKIVASNSNSKIKSWMKKYPNANWAIVTGRPYKKTGKYLVVVDIDQTSELIKSFPKTFHYKTGGGGYHFWFLSEKPISCKVAILGEKIDIRGTNGYVLIPPSNHKTGKKYHFLDGVTNEIADLPDFVAKSTQIEAKTYTKNPKTKREKIKQRKEKRVLNTVPSSANSFIDWNACSIDEIKEKLLKEEKIPIGARNSTLYRLLCSERAKGTSERGLAEKSSVLNGFLESELDQEELNRIVHSAAKHTAFNHNVQDINRIFFLWLKKQGVQTKWNQSDFDIIDQEFFDSLKKTAVFSTSLKKVQDMRFLFYKSKSVDIQPARIKPSLFAKILLAKGFEKQHTSTGNFWNIGD